MKESKLKEAKSKLKKLKPRNKWLQELKASIVVDQSKNQPYAPVYIPWAIQNRRKFIVHPDSHCAKNQGVTKMRLLNEAYQAMGGAFPKKEKT